MKKILSFILMTFVIIGVSTLKGYAKEDAAKIEMLPVFSAQTNAQNRLWVGTFQIVWNEFMDNILKGPVLFKNYESELANQLNKQEFKKSMISEDSYYTAYGETTLALKEQIEKAIMEKFNETSDVLDKIDWTDPNNAYLLYAMLKKDFTYSARFEILPAEKFNNSKTQYKYFGINEKSRPEQYSSVKVLFYNNPFDYAVALQGNNDEVILYRTNSDKTFKNLYADLTKKTEKYRGNRAFVQGDKLKIPFISVKQDIDYQALCGHEILNTDRLYIGKALNTVDFNMNNTGVKLKSEAAMSIMTMSLMPEMKKQRGRNFYFNNTFALFLKEKDKSMPYYAMRVKNMELYKYTGEIH